MIRLDLLAAAAALAITSACSPAEPVANPNSSEEAVEPSILERSSPAAGASVQAPVDQIELWFDPPARLVELTVTGADGLTMPMMVTSVGETRHYSLPVSGLEEGTYSVAWRATVGGQSHEGEFQFTVA